MTETIWFVLIAWFITLIIGFKLNQQFFLGVSSLIGIFLGFIVLTDVYVWLGLIFIFTSVYLLFHTLFRTVKGARTK